MDAMQIIGGLMLAAPAGIALLYANKCGALRETLLTIGLSSLGAVWITGALFLISGF